VRISVYKFVFSWFSFGRFNANATVNERNKALYFDVLILCCKDSLCYSPNRQATVRNIMVVRIRDVEEPQVITLNAECLPELWRYCTIRSLFYITSACPYEMNGVRVLTCMASEIITESHGISKLMVVHIRVVPLLATRHQVKFNSTGIKLFRVTTWRASSQQNYRNYVQH